MNLYGKMHILNPVKIYSSVTAKTTMSGHSVTNIKSMYVYCRFEVCFGTLEASGEIEAHGVASGREVGSGFSACLVP